jgi:GNAT superfamily N-acetyltransferase
MGEVIRVGTSSDVRALIRMHADCSTTTIERRYLSALPVLSARFAARLLCPVGGFSLVTERDHRLVAIATVAPDVHDGDQGIAEVGQLVADRYQRQGIGTAMLAAASREASRRGFAALVLAVHPDNRAVLPMVNAAGLRARISTRDGLTRVLIPLVPACREEGLHSV